MTEESTGRSTVVTRVTAGREQAETPLMSYTAVTSHRTMADAFARKLLDVGQRIIKDHDLSIEDLIAILHVACDTREESVTMLEGRHLRGRVGEQLSRADRYSEPFGLMVLGLHQLPDKAAYDSVVDTLYERMRKTDLVFLFKTRIVLLLPHTNAMQIVQLTERLNGLLAAAFEVPPQVPIASLTYPSPDIERHSGVLDWVEDQLRD
jgi:hypothetical protein